jgi:hypothetical protein
MRQQLIEAGTTDHRHVPFFCECAGKCHGRLKAILPRHFRIGGEETIEQNGRYEVVVKEAV